MRDSNYLAYLRVSTQEQAVDGVGLDAQRAAIEREAVRRGWPGVTFIEDAGHSAKDTRRPGLAEARQRLSHKNGPTGLIVAKMDRLSRSVMDFAIIMQEAQRQGWTLIALDFPVDLSTPFGEAMASVGVVFGQLERRMIGQRTKDALAVKKAQGVKLGGPRLIPPEVAERICVDRARGLSLRRIADGLNAEGVPTAQGGKQWYASTVRAVISYSC